MERARALLTDIGRQEAGLRRLVLTEDPGVTVVGEADSTAMALRVLDVELLVDLRLGDEQGMDLIEQLASTRPQTRVLVLSQASPGEVLAAMKAGAHGYVSKAATTAELIRLAREWDAAG